jgi:hypothetical protein
MVGLLLAFVLRCTLYWKHLEGRDTGVRTQMKNIDDEGFAEMRPENNAECYPIG